MRIVEMDYCVINPNGARADALVGNEGFESKTARSDFEVGLYLAF